MKPIPVKSFLAYAGIAAVFALLAFGVQRCASKSDRIDPAYKSFLEKRRDYQTAKAIAALGLDQRHFEESLAGAYPIEKLPNADLQEVARDALTAAKASDVLDKRATDRERYDAAKHLAWSLTDAYGGPKLDQRNWQVKRLLRCSMPDTCFFAPEVSVLGDPSRLLLLLNGDKSGVLANLPTEATDLGPEPTYPANAPTKMELPWTHDLQVWIVCSLVFVAFFLGVGAIGYYGPDINGANPILLPDFVFGWLVMLAFAPGFALMHGVRLSLRDARPWVARQRARLFPREFDDAFAELTAKLETMRAREQAGGNAVLLGDIDALIEKVKLNKNHLQLAALRKALDDADSSLSGIVEVERDLLGQPAD